ncbi:diguanylate cyclase [Pseudomonas sp. FW300-N1A1]|uniref:sensor domain-containing diguanylate cyclase n=1 Tax=Pseudomonas sp. FW300-N1A1 TaxID=2075555 RepID=UPI000CD065FA|nr:sensor domain-containing diguanylate cyclase [Pseudomonas sp. FW300-N1A1]POA21855.1 diguanylate cyclase [Pseudomonas sp. FW300-N1A1]
MIPMWLGLCAIGVIVVLIAVLIVRERRWRQLTAHYRAMPGGLPVRPTMVEEPASTELDDVERFKRSQYFARIGTWDWDVDTEKLYWSDGIYGMFGFKVGEVVPSYQLYCSCVHPDDRERVRAGELRCLATGENHDEEYRVVWPDGSVHWLRETGNVVKTPEQSIVKMMGVVRDITDEKASANQLQRLASALEQARRSATRVMLVFVDLNGFKAINDDFGHAAGDQVLVTTASRLKNILRASDTVARIGGDEFVVILEGLPQGKSLEEEARSICQKIFSELSPSINVGKAHRQIGTSLGVAVFPDHAPSMDTLLHIADLAMYEAKRSGNNQYRLGRHSASQPPGTAPDGGIAVKLAQS